MSGTVCGRVVLKSIKPGIRGRVTADKNVAEMRQAAVFLSFAAASGVARLFTNLLVYFIPYPPPDTAYG